MVALPSLVDGEAVQPTAVNPVHALAEFARVGVTSRPNILGLRGHSGLLISAGHSNRSFRWVALGFLTYTLYHALVSMSIANYYFFSASSESTNMVKTPSSTPIHRMSAL